MDKTFSLTDVEQQWFPVEVIERYLRLTRKLEIPQQLHRLSARGWVMLKAFRVGAKRFYAFLHKKLNCTTKTEYRHPRWFRSNQTNQLQESKELTMSNNKHNVNNQPFEPTDDVVDAAPESTKQSTSKQEETTMNKQYNTLDLETLSRLAESEIHRNEAEAAYMRRLALEQKPDRKWESRARVALTASTAVAMGAIAVFYLKHSGIFDGLLGGSQSETTAGSEDTAS